ncbi:MAG: DUF2505 domain-containing protein [Myxococcales bacterium]|nr:DUF2505 domain-containing protein [Myxococcales bacterium]
MIKFTLTHEINCDPDTFWKLFFDKEFNDALYKGALGFTKYDLLESKDSDKQLVRKVNAVPKVDLPGPIAKLMGPGFGYVEDGVLDKATKRWTWTLTTSTMADKLKQNGTLKVEAAGEGKCRRVAEISGEAKVFGLGGMIESTIEKELRQGWDKSAEFMNKWIRDGKAK